LKGRREKTKTKKSFVHLKNALLGALGTEDISAVGDESLSNQCHVAASALEAIIVPMAVLERDESRAANTFELKKRNDAYIYFYCFNLKIRS